MMNAMRVGSTNTGQYLLMALRKPTYYLWRNDFSSQEEFEAERRKYADIGFRVVTFLDGDSNTNIHDGIKALVKNHWDNV